jgi:hypothetical protein
LFKESIIDSTTLGDFFFFYCTDIGLLLLSDSAFLLLPSDKVGMVITYTGDSSTTE